MRMVVKCNGVEVVYALNDNAAAKGLVAQLPLELEVQPFSSNEITVYPPSKLDVSDSQLAGSGGRGVLAHYEPWGDVVFFHDDFEGNSSLFELGVAESGVGGIEGMRGTATLEAL